MNNESIEKTVILSVGGMSCNHCVGRVKKALEKINGVKSAQVSLAEGKAVVTGEQLNPKLLKEAVEEAGYSAEVVEK